MNLYTKYRSQKFSEVVGQEQVVRVLTNAIALEKVGHAYLFSGPRGTGKTTLARLLAKSLNCIDRKKGEFEPCGKCSSCHEINLGTSMDIIEIDAASNRGIDEIRALRDKARFVASGSRYKVFIIDEVHMLTREAFNALLKILEEPPKHVIFIMATTEAHKVPDTILSRTMSFDFGLHKLPDIVAQIEMIAKKEKINIDSQSVRLIAQNAKGGMRDAITILDQVSASSKKIDEKLTREVLGLSSFESLALMSKFILSSDKKNALKLVEKLLSSGVDIYQFCLELLEIMQKIMLFDAGLDSALDVFTKEEKATIVKIACLELSREVEAVQIVEIVEKLMDVVGQTKNSEMPELPLELAIVELTGGEQFSAFSHQPSEKKFEIRSRKYEISQTYSEQSNDKLKTINNKNIKSEEKISHPERSEGFSREKILHSVQNDSKKNHETRNRKQDTRDEKREIGDRRQELSNKMQETGGRRQETGGKIDLKLIQDKWSDFLAEFSKENGLKTFLEKSVPVKVEDEKLEVAVQFKFYKDGLEKSKNYQKFVNKFEEFFRSVVAIKFNVDDKLVNRASGTGSADGGQDDSLTSDAEDIFK